jgi:hypothetical protein
VGLDEDQTVAEYLQASGDAPPPRTEIPPREDEARENRENEERISRLEAAGDAPGRQIPWGLFAALLLLIALAFALWNRRQHEHAGQLLPPATASRTPVPSALLAAPSANRTGQVSTGETDRGETHEESGSGSPNAVSPTAASSSRTPEEFSVVIQAHEESWVSITADGKTAQSELLPSGTERLVRGRGEVIVKIGNAGGVEFRFNGKKLDTGGRFGEVKTVTFGPGGVISNASPPPSMP